MTNYKYNDESLDEIETFAKIIKIFLTKQYGHYF